MSHSTRRLPPARLSTLPMARYSLSQPGHRRPTWAKTEQSYRAYIIDNPGPIPPPGPDYGMDNFAYDPAYLPVWQMPTNVSDELPSALRTPVLDWIYAGAAVCTSLERIERLFASAKDRVQPMSSHAHIFRGRSVGPSMPVTAAVASLDTPPHGVSPEGKVSEAALSLPLGKLDLNTTLLPPPTLGMESPPCTPVDTQGFTTPTLPRGPTIGSFPTTIDEIDGPVWETYLGTCTAELHDLRVDVLMRLKGYARIIDRVVAELELKHMRTRAIAAAADRDALAAFVAWWRSCGKVTMAEYEEKVRAVQLPMREEVLMGRAKGE